MVGYLVDKLLWNCFWLAVRMKKNLDPMTYSIFGGFLVPKPLVAYEIRCFFTSYSSVFDNPDLNL